MNAKQDALLETCRERRNLTQMMIDLSFNRYFTTNQKSFVACSIAFVFLLVKDHKQHRNVCFIPRLQNKVVSSSSDNFCFPGHAVPCTDSAAILCTRLSAAQIILSPHACTLLYKVWHFSISFTLTFVSSSIKLLVLKYLFSKFWSDTFPAWFAEFVLHKYFILH